MMTHIGHEGQSQVKHLSDWVSIALAAAALLTGTSVPLWLHFGQPKSLPFVKPTESPARAIEFGLPVIRQGTNNVDLQFNNDGSITWRRL